MHSRIHIQTETCQKEINLMHANVHISHLRFAQKYGSNSFVNYLKFLQKADHCKLNSQEQTCYLSYFIVNSAKTMI